MNSKIQQINKQDLSWFIGFFVGDGYTTKGRVGIDTTSPDNANRILKVLRQISEKVKVEVYGSPNKFHDLLPNNYLLYQKKKAQHSDHIKIRIDDTKFQRAFLEFKEKYVDNIPFDLIGDFLQGFFDAEATVSPIGQIEIDLSKDNKPIMQLIGKLLPELEIKHKIKEHKSRLRLEISGTSKNVPNLMKFQKSINFYDSRKREELDNMIQVYSNPINDGQEIEFHVLAYIKENPSADLKTLMTTLNVRYDFLRRSINSLMKDGKIEKFELNKRRCFKIVS